MDGATILLVDDTPENLKVLRTTLEGEGSSILVATSGEEALRSAAGVLPDLILLDVMMPGMDGFETCRRLKADDVTREIPVIFVTARAETEAILDGFHSGGIDYIVKPFQSEEVLARVQTHLRVYRLSRELAEKNEQLENEKRERTRLADQLSLISSREANWWGIEGFIGESPTIREMLTSIARVQETNATVLITGESGTGKELIARAIHHRSGRAGGAFVPVNCSAIPGELAESHLFGHVRGAFTGADRDRKGMFELADGGTLFLDEIGEMPAAIQAKLLRVLEDGRFQPVGGTREKQVEVRVLAATNADLPSRVSAGDFRQDLYFRLARFPVAVPPLRQRTEDIPLLARHFLRIFAEEMGKEAPELSGATLDALIRYGFPGNVRELKNIVEGALIESGGGEVRPEHLHFFTVAEEPGPAQSVAGFVGDQIPLNLKAAESVLIRRALEQTHDNITAAALLLGTNRNKIYKFIEEERDRS